MKFTVNVTGIDNGFIERLAAAADRKLAPKLRRLAARQARRTHAATHHASAIHPATPVRHAAAHRPPSHRATSHPAIVAAVEAAALHGLIKALGGAGKYSALHDTTPLMSDPGPSALEPFEDNPADTVSEPAASSSDGDSLFDLTLDADYL